MLGASWSVYNSFSDLFRVRVGAKVKVRPALILTDQIRARKLYCRMVPSWALFLIVGKGLILNLSLSQTHLAFREQDPSQLVSNSQDQVVFYSWVRPHRNVPTDSSLLTSSSSPHCLPSPSPLTSSPHCLPSSPPLTSFPHCLTSPSLTAYLLLLPSLRNFSFGLQHGEVMRAHSTPVSDKVSQFFYCWHQQFHPLSNPGLWQARGHTVAVCLSPWLPTGTDGHQ